MIAPTPSSTPLVGREREQTVLREQFHAAMQGHGSLVLIGGEAGIGKTALAEGLCQEAAECGALVLVGRCFDLAETPAYGPWLYLFERYQPSDGFPPPPPAFAEPGQVGPVASQSALFRQVLDFLKALTSSRPEGIRPTILLLDDLHWSDPASLELLRFLAQYLATLPLLLLVTYRSDELTRRHPLYALLPALVREAGATRIDLRALGAADVRALVDARYALAAADAARLADYLAGRAEGNAFFIEELLRTLEEERVLDRHDAGWRLGDVAGVRVPALLKQVVDGRVTRLGDGVQQALGVAAVIGQEVPFDIWATVVECDEAALLDAAERAIAARLIEAAADGIGIRFVHALIREALYEGILPLRRRALHRRIGDVLAASANPDPDAVAHHFQQAGDERAAEWLVRAGERAERAYAWLMAAERYEMAASLMERAGADAGERGWLMHRIAILLRHADPHRALTTLDEAERLAAQAGDRGLATYLLHTRGFIRCVVGDHRRGLADLAASADGLDAMAEAEYAQLRARTDGVPLNRRHTRGTLAIRLTRVGRYAEARSVAEYVIADAPPPGEIVERGGSYIGDAYNALIETYGALGLPERAEWAFRQAVATYRAAEHFLLISGSNMHALLWLFLPYRADDVATRHRAMAAASEALRRASGMHGTTAPPLAPLVACLFTEGRWSELNAATPALLAANVVELARISLGPLARAQGDADQAWAHVRAILPHGDATEPGETEFMPALAMQRLAAALTLDAGDLDTARAWLEAHDRWLAWAGVVLGQSEGQALWAQYHRAAGDPDRATEHAERALSHATEPRQPLALLAAHRLLGDLATERGRFADAEEHLAASLALADACAAPYERALTLLATAELRAATGDVEMARTLLDEVRAICTPLNARLALARADALDARLSATRTRNPTYPAGLSAREVEVLRLIAAGKTNREIADALFLSPATVNIHVTHILTKTNTANRAEAAAFALRHGLA